MLFPPRYFFFVVGPSSGTVASFCELTWLASATPPRFGNSILMKFSLTWTRRNVSTPSTMPFPERNLSTLTGFAPFTAFFRQSLMTSVRRAATNGTKIRKKLSLKLHLPRLIRPFQGVSASTQIFLRLPSRSIGSSAIVPSTSSNSNTQHVASVDKQLQTRAVKTASRAAQASSSTSPRQKIRRTILSGLPASTDPAKIYAALEDISIFPSRVELLRSGTSFLLHLPKTSSSFLSSLLGLQVVFRNYRRPKKHSSTQPSFSKSPTPLSTFFFL